MSIRAVADCDICKKEFQLLMEEGRRGGYFDPGNNSVVIGLSFKEEADFEFDTVCLPCRTALKSAIGKTISALKPNRAKANKQAGRKAQP